MSSSGDHGSGGRRPRLRLTALLIVGGAVIAFATAGGRTSGGKPLEASRFARGACEAFAPTVGDRHLTVFLDAGHGGRDPGAVGVTKSGHEISKPTRRCASSSTRWPCCAPRGSASSSRARATRRCCASRPTTSAAAS